VNAIGAPPLPPATSALMICAFSVVGLPSTATILPPSGIPDASAGSVEPSFAFVNPPIVPSEPSLRKRR